ncbi:MAG: thrombospondin type 3 repeat-containing protein [Chromatiales bacterium]|nr:thrombospondin type 3 repeat-containing protein [Chromatiales bacterium]
MGSIADKKYTLYSLLVRGGHVVWADFDELVPRLAGVGVSGTGVTSETLSALSHVSATGYWIVVAQGSAAPTSLQVKAGSNYSVALATVGVVAAGNGDMVELTDATFSVTGLTAGTGYDLYLVGYSVNNDGLGYTPSKISFTTDVDSDGDGVGDSTDLFPADPTRAVSCLAGSYGAYSCVAAAPGYYVPVANALVQTACAVGSYTDTIGAVVAVSCPAGDSTVSGASTSRTDCLLDTDLDGSPDLVDSDDDGDGVLDATDNCPLIANADQLDTDSDGQGNVCDADDDGDGVLDADDAFPLDATESADGDSDGLGDNADNCPLTANADQLDTDADGQGNVCDTDDDNDGVLDADDAFPLDVSLSAVPGSGGGGAFNPFLLLALLGSQRLFRRRRG